MLQNWQAKTLTFNPKEMAKDIIYMTESAVYGQLTITWVFVMCSIVYRWYMECVNSYKLLPVGIYGLTSCNESSLIMHQTHYFLCVGANGYWWVCVCVCVGHQCLFVFPSQMFSSVGDFRRRKCIFFKNSGDFFLIFRFRNKFTKNNNNNHQISLLGSSTR